MNYSSCEFFLLRDFATVFITDQGLLTIFKSSLYSRAVRGRILKFNL